MADLTVAGRSPEGRRGQILLVTALVLGVAFVALAVILNSAIFTENLASRGDTTGGDEVVTYGSNLEDGVAALVVYENHNASGSESHATVLDRVETGVADANDVMVRRHARRGAIVNASVTGHTEGARIFQTNSSRNFSDGTGDRNWTVANDVDGARAFRLNVSQAGLSSTCTLLTDCFSLNVTDGSDTWRVAISDTPSGVEVRVDNGTTTTSCDPVDEPFVTVDVTAGTVGGEPCSALDFGDAPAPPYDIEFGFADRVTGTYSVVVADGGIATSPPAHFGADDDPSVTAAIYALTLAYDYETPDVTVVQHLRVAPGESDGR